MTRKRTTSAANLTIDDAAHLLSASPGTIRNMIARGELKAFKLGRALRIPAPEVERLGAYVPTSTTTKADA